MDEKSLSELISELAIEEALEKGKRLFENSTDLISFQNEIIIGITRVGEKYYHGQCFIADLMVAGVLAQDLFSLMEEKNRCYDDLIYGKVVIGTISGDIHDIGKNLISDALVFRGVEVIDLGVDVSASRFLKAVEEHKPDILAISNIMDSTFREIRKLVQQLFKLKLNENTRIIVGGVAANNKYLKINGVDLMTNNFQEGINYCVEVFNKKRHGEINGE